jgi:aspartyl-tRNA(Asn)/glutamyl-tRNA(Gln) amidotransferase subunit C
MDLQEVSKVAKLARLQLSEADLARMAEQLSNILAYVDQLKELNTDNVEPLAHPLPVHNVFREDVPTGSLPVDKALANAPRRAGNFFGVPAVIDPAEEPSH